MSVVFLPPQFGVHLQPHVLKIHVPVDVLKVDLSHVVVGTLPVQLVGIGRAFLPVIKENKGLVR